MFVLHDATGGYKTASIACLTLSWAANVGAMTKIVRDGKRDKQLDGELTKESSFVFGVAMAVSTFGLDSLTVRTNHESTRPNFTLSPQVLPWKDRSVAGFPSVKALRITMLSKLAEVMRG